MKYETNEQLQRIVDYAWQQQQRQEQIQRAVDAGDQELAHFLGLKPELQQTLLAHQDVQDAAAAANAGDEHGLRQAVGAVVNRVLHHGAQLGPRQQRPLPRRRNQGKEFRV